jgi:hypothetical protein
MTYLYWITGIIAACFGLVYFVRWIINREAIKAINSTFGED